MLEGVASRGADTLLRGERGEGAGGRRHLVVHGGREEVDLLTALYLRPMGGAIATSTLRGPMGGAIATSSLQVRWAWGERRSNTKVVGKGEGDG